MPQHNPFDISYTQANDPVDCASHSEFGLPASPKDPLENMLYDKYVTNYARLIAGSSNLVGLSSFTSECGETDLLAPYNGTSNGIPIHFMLGDIASISTSSLENAIGLSPKLSLIERRNIQFGAVSGWVGSVSTNRYGWNHASATPALAESEGFGAYISGEIAAGRVSHLFYWLGANLFYNNHVGIEESELGNIIYSGIFDEAQSASVANIIVDSAKTVIGAAKSAGAKGIVIGGVYNKFLMPTGWQMGFTNPVGIGRVDYALNVLNSGLKSYAQTIGGVFVDYRELQRDMQGNMNEKPCTRFPAPYSQYAAQNQRYDSQEAYLLDGSYSIGQNNGQAMFSRCGGHYYNLGLSHVYNVALHALNKCYGTNIRLIDPTEMVQLCGLRTTHTTNVDRIVGGGSGLLPQKDNGGTIIGNESRGDLINEGLGSKNPIKNTCSSDFPENTSRANQSSVRFGGTNLPKRQEYDPRTG